MKNPTIKQVNFVIEKLQLVREQASEYGAFDMIENRVYSKKHKHECGTVHCTAGWYAVANSDRQVIKDKINQGCVDFRDGADLMAIDLGFDNTYDLKCWAYENPEIWGNEDGRWLFAKDEAYNTSGFEGVIAQWQLVKQNLIELGKI